MESQNMRMEKIYSSREVLQRTRFSFVFLFVVAIINDSRVLSEFLQRIVHPALHRTLTRLPCMSKSVNKIEISAVELHSVTKRL